MSTDPSTPHATPSKSSALTNGSKSSSKTSSPRDSRGWDGKLRIEKKATLTNPEALSDPEYSDEDAPPPEQIQADEDLLEDYDEDTDEIDLSHLRVSSITALRLERFPKLEKLCLRQNHIVNASLPSTLAPTLTELDLYDNLIKHIPEEGGISHLTKLTSLDLSFNKLKHIKNIETLTSLTDLYFVQNRIRKIENLDSLTKLRNLELGGNQLRNIENLEALTALEELWLGKNKISSLSPLPSFPALTILSIQSNRLTTLEDLPPLPKLEELHVSHNLLTSIKGLSKETVPQLRVLDISSNPIPSLVTRDSLTRPDSSRSEAKNDGKGQVQDPESGGLHELACLEELWASYCQLSDFGEIERELGGSTELHTVYFEGNPLQLRGPAVYRNKVRLALPRVRQIDATFVRAE